MTWSEKLRDARWQRKADEVLAFNDHTCECCERTPDTLPSGVLLCAHHIYYVKHRDPWDYPVTDLMCLCEDCHTQTEEAIIELRKAFGHLPYWEINNFVAEFTGVCEKLGGPDARSKALRFIKANILPTEQKPVRIIPKPAEVWPWKIERRTVVPPAPAAHQPQPPRPPEEPKPSMPAAVSSNAPLSSDLCFEPDIAAAFKLADEEVAKIDPEFAKSLTRVEKQICYAGKTSIVDYVQIAFPALASFREKLAFSVMQSTYEKHCSALLPDLKIRFVNKDGPFGRVNRSRPKL